MQTKNIDLSISNPALAGLSARSYAAKITEVPNGRLPADLRELLSTVYAAINNDEELPLDDCTIVIAASDSGTGSFVYSRSYLPKFYKGNDGQLIVKWGQAEIPFNVMDSGIAPANSGKGYKVDLSFGKVDISGRGEDSALFVSVIKDKVLTRMPFALGVADIREFDIDAASTLLKMDPESLLPLFVAPSSGGGADFEGPMVSLRDEQDKLVAAGYFTADNPTLAIEVTAYKLIQVSGGTRTSCLLQAEPCEALGQPGKFHFWGNGRITNGLRSEPTVSPDLPAQVIMTARGGASLLLNDGAVTNAAPGMVDLDF